jgi:hypothetical protein
MMIMMMHDAARTRTLLCRRVMMTEYYLLWRTHIIIMMLVLSMVGIIGCWPALSPPGRRDGWFHSSGKQGHPVRAPASRRAQTTHTSGRGNDDEDDDMTLKENQSSLYHPKNEAKDDG